MGLTNKLIITSVIGLSALLASCLIAEAIKIQLMQIT
jgi:hypothetical protein